MGTYGKRLGLFSGNAILIAMLLSGSVGSADLKIGSVDIQKAVNECSAGKEAKKALAKEVEKFQRLVAEKQKELQDLKESLEKQGPMLNAETRAAKEKDLQNRIQDFQRWGEDTQNEINQKRTEMERTISIGLQSVIQRVGEDEGYTLILEKNENIALFTSSSIDITDRVIKAYDLQKK